MPGVVTCTQVLQALASAIPIEAANTMMYETSGPYALREDPPVWAQYRAALKDAGVAVELKPIEKWEFYKAVATPDHVLTIQTADQQRFANLLLTVDSIAALAAPSSSARAILCPYASRLFSIDYSRSLASISLRLSLLKRCSMP